ncbi:MAG: hypothetical protein WCS87_18350, partial [Methylococcaceae bacterium]
VIGEALLLMGKVFYGNHLRYFKIILVIIKSSLFEKETLRVICLKKTGVQSLQLLSVKQLKLFYSGYTLNGINVKLF